MHGQNWMQRYEEDMANAEVRHQRPLQEAHEEFKRACDEAEQQRNAIYLAARDAWEAVVRRAQVATSFTAARRALAEAVRQADEDLQAEVRIIAGRHNITVL